MKRLGFGDGFLEQCQSRYSFFGSRCTPRSVRADPIDFRVQQRDGPNLRWRFAAGWTFLGGDGGSHICNFCFRILCGPWAVSAVSSQQRDLHRGCHFCVATKSLKMVHARSTSTVPGMQATHSGRYAELVYQPSTAYISTGRSSWTKAVLFAARYPRSY